MEKLHLYHISFFDSLFKGLRSNGVSLERFAQQSYLRRFNLHRPNTYLPIEVSYQLLDKVKRSQGIDCISSEFYGRFQVEDLSDYGQYLSRCPDLHSILLNAIKYDYLIQTNGKLSLKTEGAYSWFSMVHDDAPSEGRQISEQINLAMFLKAFQFVLGPAWIPLEVHITSPNGKWLKNIFPSSDFNLKTSCPEIAFRFKTKELASKNKYYVKQPNLLNADLRSMEDVTVIVLNSMKGSYKPTLDGFSRYFGFSKRTMIRGYASAGTSYKEILEKHLFMRALKLLEDNNDSIEEISYLLGYSHPSNFIRTFKRWTSKTPHQYRLQASNL
jgi:AraC-like DNA-binding protein